MRLHFSASLPRDDIALGVVIAGGVRAGAAGPSLSEAIDACVAERKAPLPPELETRRGACRDMLRNGVYKPTGRAKPASEYLVRTALEGAFPRINALVDSNNFVSLRHLVPISVWDLDLAASERFDFHLGGADESYVFNSGGQVLQLQDLLCGHAWSEAEQRWVPIVNPVKDCLRTKTTDATTAVAGVVYCPVLPGFGVKEIEAVTAELRDRLLESAPGARGASAVLESNGSLSLELPTD